jgi:hypothetical protein
LGWNPGKFVCILGGEYTDYSCEVHKTLLAVKDLEDLAHMKRILLDGCPTDLMFEKPLRNKMEIFQGGIQKASMIIQK